MELVDKNLVKQLITSGHLYSDVSKQLQEAYLNIVRGLSPRSVRQYCTEQGIKRIKGADLDTIVEELKR